MILRNDLEQDRHAEQTAKAFDSRVYSCQNWRADVVALVDEDGVLLERAWYDPCGTPKGLPAADLSSASVSGLPDGIRSGADDTQWSAQQPPRPSASA